MKSNVLLITVIALLGISVNVFGQTKTAKFKCDVTCNSCKSKIEKNVGYEKGVNGVDANIESDIVTVTYDESKTNLDALSASLKKIGFENTLVAENSSAGASQQKPCPKSCTTKTDKKDCPPECTKECCAKKKE